MCDSSALHLFERTINLFILEKDIKNGVYKGEGAKERLLKMRWIGFRRFTQREFGMAQWRELRVRLASWKVRG